MQQKRIIYMGTPQFSATVLEALIQANYNITLVVTQPDKKVGRKQEIEYSPVKKIALKYGIEVFQPLKIKTDFQIILNKDPQCVITCAYGQIIPDEILNYPEYKCINIHASLLPKYRGGAPIHKAIMNGDKETGISIMEMVSKMDAGAVCYTKKYPISDTITTSELFEELALVAKDAILEALPMILKKEAIFVEQDESQVTYAYTIKKVEEKIDVTLPIEQVYNITRGLLAFPAGYIIVNGKKIKLHKVSMEVKNHNKLYEFEFKDDCYYLYLNGGVLKIYALQLEGKKKMDAKTFHNGFGSMMNKVEV